MKLLDKSNFKGHIVELYRLDNSYMIRIDGQTDLQHQAFAWNIQTIENIANKLVDRLVKVEVK